MRLKTCKNATGVGFEQVDSIDIGMLLRMKVNLGWDAAKNLEDGAGK
jgi:hypothetical protein